MSIVQKISVRTLPSGPDGRRRNCVNMSYMFNGDAASQRSNGPVVFNGTSFVFDVSAVAGGFSIGEIKALQFASRFYVNMNQAGPFNYDGLVSIYSPSTGQFAQIGLASQAFSGASGFGTSESGVVSGVIPIIASAPTLLVIGKSVASDGLLYGRIDLTAFDFDIAPWMNQGITAISS